MCKIFKMERLEREREARRKTASKEGRKFAVFVQNIPQNLDQYGMNGIFQRAGRVSDTYITFRRRKRSNERFSFVRFRRMAEGMKSILILNNSIVRGCRIGLEFPWQNTRKLELEEIIIDNAISTILIDKSRERRRSIRRLSMPPKVLDFVRIS